MTKNLVLALSCLGIVGLAFAQAPSNRSAELAAAERMIEAMGGKESMLQQGRAMMEQAIERGRQQYGGDMSQSCSGLLFDRMQALLESRMPELLDKMIEAYAETFDVWEMNGISQFYLSPAGQAFLDKQPQLNARIMENVLSFSESFQTDMSAVAEEASQTCEAPEEPDAGN
jgi:hypothetical protein